MNATKRDREVDDEDELVGFCEGRFAGLKNAFTLGGGASMVAGDLRSYSLEELKVEVEKRGGDRILVPPWLDAYNLRCLLRDYESPAVTKKAKVAESIPPVVFRADQDPKDFVAQVKGCAIEPIPWAQENDPNICCMTLPEGMSWLTLDSRHLFVRSRYAELWKLMEEQFKIWRQPLGEVSNRIQHVLLLGNTGIGKTASMNYFLRRALDADYCVLFETRERRYFFHDGTVEWEKLSDSVLENYRTNPSVLFFVDHQQGKSPPFCDAFTVAPVSPDPSNYSEWDKNRCLRLWMPLTTREEVLAMNWIESKVDEGVLEELLLKYGPIPRQLFRRDQETAAQLLQSKIAAFDFQKCRTLGVLVSGELPESKSGLSWWILHVTTTDLRKPSYVGWATSGIMHKVLERYDGNRMKELETEIAELLNQPSALHAPDGEFQYWSCRRIASGIEVETFEPCYEANQYVLRSSPKVSFQLPQKDVVFVRTLAAVKDMTEQDGAVFYSQLSNEPLCDAAAVCNGELLLFQMTIGKNHGFKKPTFTRFCKEAKNHNLTCVRFVFVVPHKQNFSVSKEQIKLFQEDYGVDVALEIAEICPKA